MSDLALQEPLILGGKTAADVTRDVCRPLERKATPLWWAAFSASFALLMLGVVAVGYQVATGIGTWGLNKTVGWAFDITNFVFWVGIGHAGTLISAILFLFRQKWRTSVNRSAEAMTLIAVICAGIFPLIHMGRPWLAFWVLPYPNQRGSLWVNFRSPLLWDVFAISVYFTVSAVFWYFGLVPDLATIRDRSDGLRKRLTGVFSLGWNGSLRTWNRYELVYLLLAGLATPLVLSVHSIVSFDFATSVVPGWHTTIFPPYFVAGAIFSGMSMVLTLMIIARAVMHLEEYITLRHIDAMTKLVLATSGMVALAYATEFFTALYSGNPYEGFAFMNRAFGPYAWGYWIMVVCNLVVPQIYWFRSVRRNVVIVFIASILVNVGMWFERFIIIVTSLQRDYIPSSWVTYKPTAIEIATLAGSFGLFFTLFLIFCRFLPMIAMAEVKGVLNAPLHHPEQGKESPSQTKGSPGAASHDRDHLSSAIQGRPDLRLDTTNRAGGLANQRRRPCRPGDDRRYLTAYFRNEGHLASAVAELRTSGYEISDVYTPYAIHGLDRVAGLPHSRLGWVCAIGGFTGAGSILFFQSWTSSVSWALNVGGKPFNSIPAFIPVTFEVGVLAATLGTVAAFLIRSRLYPGKRPIPNLPLISSERFAVVVEEKDASVTAGGVRQICEANDSTEFETGVWSCPER